MKFPQNKETNQKISNLLAKLQKEKMRSFYVDWDPTNGKWFFFDKHEQYKEKIADIALKLCKILIETTVENLGDLSSETPEEKSQLFLAGKARALCAECGFSMRTKEDLKHHDARGGSLQMKWYKVP